MHLSAQSSRLAATGRGFFLREVVSVLALSLVLFALTFRTALPLGVAVVTDDDGIPFVICQQISNIQQQLASTGDPAPSQSTPAYQCAFCMVLNADHAPLLTYNAPDFRPRFLLTSAALRLPQMDLRHAEWKPRDNLGRDPPPLAYS